MRPVITTTSPTAAPTTRWVTRHCTAFRPLRNGSIRKGRPERLTAHAGVLLLRELDERLGAASALESALDDLRTPTRVEHPLGLLLRTAIYGMAIDSAHAAAAADLADDAVFRIATSDRRGLSMLEEDAATPSQSTLSRLGSLLSTDGNLSVLRGALFDWAVNLSVPLGPNDWTRSLSTSTPTRSASTGTKPGPRTTATTGRAATTPSASCSVRPGIGSTSDCGPATSTPPTERKS